MRLSVFAFLLSGILFSPAVSAFEFVVTDTADAGPGTLREAILSAQGNPGHDTIYINVRGTLVLQSSITINDNGLTIVGPSPKHFTIVPSAFIISPHVLRIAESSDIFISGIRFTSDPALAIRMLQCESNSGLIQISRCLFEDGSNAFGLGGAVAVLSTAGGFTTTFLSCSFINNSADYGGAMYLDNSFVNIQNCTFVANSATQEGGAFYNSNGNVVVQNCTFKANTAGFGGQLAANEGSLTFQNNAGAGNGSLNHFIGGGVYLTSGGNVFQANATDSWPFPVNPFDVFGPIINGLRPALLTDGFGLKYYPIINAASTYINAGNTSGSWALSQDCRLAPRILGAASGSMNPDAGAAEFTPQRVINNSNNVGTPGSLPFVLGLGLPSAPFFVEFDVPGGPTTMTASSSLVLSNRTILDAFTQEGSAVAGPGIEGFPGVTPSVPGFTVSGNNAVPNGFDVLPAAGGSRISGFCLMRNTQACIFNSSDGTQISGNHIGVVASASGDGCFQSGIHVWGDGVIIGGYEHWQRNVISGNGMSAGFQNIFVNSTNARILGNFIGTSTDGTAVVGGTLSSCIYIASDMNTIVGSPGIGNRNIIGGAGTWGIESNSSTNGKIFNNYVGVGYDGLIPTVNQNGGILAGDFSSLQIGTGGFQGGNIVSGNPTNILVKGVSALSVVNNLIGPDKSGTAIPAGTSISGIMIDGINSGVIEIGGTADGLNNFISGNTDGIVVHLSSADVHIFDNFIGFQTDSLSDLGNVNHGIHIKKQAGLVKVGTPGSGNYIGWTENLTDNGTGLRIDSTTAVFHSVVSNYIGINPAGLPAGNELGIRILAASSQTIGGMGSGASLVGGDNQNVISGNLFGGILFDENAQSCYVIGNIIGLDETGTVALGNGNFGIKTKNASFTQIGGGFLEGNVISSHVNASNDAAGIYVDGPGISTTIAGNLIGLDQNGGGVFGNDFGIRTTSNHGSISLGSVAYTPNFICNSGISGIRTGTPGILIDNNFIGIDYTGVPAPNQTGIHADTNDVFIGGSAGNIIVASTLDGILLGSNSKANTIDNSLVGTDQSGALGLGNLRDGIRIEGGDDNFIGTVDTNVIAGNGEAGIHLLNIAEKNVIQSCTFWDIGGFGNNIGIHIENSDSSDIGYNKGNFIGNCVEEGILIVNSTGTFVHKNRIGNDGLTLQPNFIGVHLIDADGNFISGDTTDQFNVISGNDSCGILLEASDNNIIDGNLIGQSESVFITLPNGTGVCILAGSTNNTIGATGFEEKRNTISGNLHTGVVMNSPGNNIMANLIGLNSWNLWTLPDQDIGVHLLPGADNTLVGGDYWAGYSSYYSGNLETGLKIESSGNTVLGNRFGMFLLGWAMGVQPIGLLIDGPGASNNVIGEASSVNNFANAFINSDTAAIRISNGASMNTITNNYIGLTPIGFFSTNQNIGVELLNAGSNNLVGEEVEYGGNLISRNGVGVLINNTSSNFVYNNKIGLTFNGLNDAPNECGVRIKNGSQDNAVGGTGFKKNFISGNTLLGVNIAGTGTVFNSVAGNVIGLKIDSTTLANSNGTGVRIEAGAEFNTIGLVGAGLGNLISANEFAGVMIDGANLNHVRNNAIGTIAPNVHGVVLVNGAFQNIIGGDASNKNIISGNDSTGVMLVGVAENKILGNFIGVAANGSDTLPNMCGIFLDNADTNYIGTMAIDEGNLISGNDSVAIKLKSSARNLIQNNLIGTDLTGVDTLNSLTLALAGIVLTDSDSNLVGGSRSSLEGNTIVNHNIHGIQLYNSSANQIYGNNVGISAGGFQFFGQGADGIRLDGDCSLNSIGKGVPDYENVISDNYSGIVVAGGDDNDILRNFIGTNHLGEDPTATTIGVNGQKYGVVLTAGASGNDIGVGNVISGNERDGILLTGSGTVSNLITSNFIGVDVSGNNSLPNKDGITISDSASSNMIGGSTVLKNVIASNTKSQCLLDGPGTQFNIIAGNYFGIGNDGSTALPAPIGIGFTDGAKGNIVGLASATGTNFICNIDTAILMMGGPNDPTGNIVQNNSIGEGPVSTSAFPGIWGILFIDADSNRVGGTGPFEGNNIAWFGGGIGVGNGAVANAILSNSIHDISGLGIDLGADGIVLVNDDVYSTNFNNEIDKPELLVAFQCLGTSNTQVAYRVKVPVGVDYHVEFFASDGIAGETGDGLTWLASHEIVPLISGDTFYVNLGSLVVGDVITATITRVSGADAMSTSEFSDNLEVIATPLYSIIATAGTCLGIENGYFEVTAPFANLFSMDGAIPADTAAGYILYPAISGSHNIDITYINGCIVNESIFVDPGPALTFTTTLADDTCGQANGEIHVFATSGTSPWSYSYTSGTYFSGFQDSLNLSAGTYGVVVVDAIGCSSGIVLIDILPYNIPGPAPDIISAQTGYCPGDPLAYLEISGGGPADWYEGGYPSIPVANAATFTPSVLNTGNNYVWATIIDGSGCLSLPDSILLVLSDTSLLFAMNDTEICPGTQIILEAFGGSSYVWTAHPDITDPTDQNPSVQPQMSTTYTVMITDFIGCIKMDDVDVELRHPDSCRVGTYTVFTPNGDGINDYLHIDGIEGYPNNVVTFFNRWGDVIIRIEKYNNKENSWHGEQRIGGEAKSGTYFYVIESLPNENATFKNNLSGWVQLMK